MVDLGTNSWFAFLLAGIVGCTSAHEIRGPEHSATAGLVAAQSCEDLLGKIHEDAVAKVRLEADQLRTSDGFYIEGGIAADFGFETDGAPPRAAPTADSGATTSGSDPSSFSETNTQVPGVDEADIVKTNGRRVYVLHGQQLFVLKSWPPKDSAIEGHYVIEGYPLEMFVSEDHVVVFSQTFHEAAGDTFCGGGIRPLPADGTFFEGDVACGRQLLKITVADVADAATPATLREYYVEGSYTSSRRHESTVRVIARGDLGGYTSLPSVYEFTSEAEFGSDAWKEAVDDWEASAIAHIRETTLEDWLPKHYVPGSEGLVAQAPPCSDFFSPAAALTTFGLTSVLTFDMLDSADPIGAVHVLGAASEVYSNTSVLLVAQNDWSRRFEGGSRTLLHAFGLDGAETNYTGSAFVPGHVHDQFSLDEQAGTIRISTTQDVWVSSDGEVVTEPAPDGTVVIDDELSLPPPDVRPTTINQVLTLRVNAGELAQLGTTGPLAEGEQIFSTRFVGDLGYVVTFRRVDPLFVVDLSDPTAPTVLGELKIPGFSDYMHPLGEDHLLTIGRDTREIDGRVIDAGLLLQVFDVSDPTSPQLAHRFAFATEGYSEANENHKAFTYDAERHLLAFPFVSYYGDFSSSLQLFRVTPEAGFEPLGAVSHTDLVQDQCSPGEPTPEGAFWACHSVAEVRRGLFIDDFVYSISTGGMKVNALSQLEPAIATVPLPPPSVEGTTEPRLAFVETDPAL